MSRRARHLPRRDVLKTSASAMLFATTGDLVLPEPAAAAGGLPAELRGILVKTMDAIIPAEAGMPSASQAGGLSYFERRAAREPEFRTHLQAFLLRESLPSMPDITDALREIQRAHPEPFAQFRDAVYEAYYTNPAIWKRLGYRFHSSTAPAVPIHEFDGSVLRRVASMQPLYREVE